MRLKDLFWTATVLGCSASNLIGSQMVAASPSRSQIRLGETFTIELTVTPPENIDALVVECVVPTGFTVMPPAKPVPSNLRVGSSYTTFYEITPPSRGHSTTETYGVLFNIKYKHADPAAGDQYMFQSVSLPFSMVFNRTHFYFWGILGLTAGWFIKSISSVSGVVLGMQPSAKESRLGIRVAIAFLARREVTQALTSLALGFVALLVLSRQNLPTGAAHDTLALGLALGFLSDDQLLSRLSVVVPRKGAID
jgi:hypothetical protein